MPFFIGPDADVKTPTNTFDWLGDFEQSKIVVRLATASSVSSGTDVGWLGGISLCVGSSTIWPKDFSILKNNSSRCFFWVDIPKVHSSGSGSSSGDDASATTKTQQKWTARTIIIIRRKLRAISESWLVCTSSVCECFEIRFACAREMCLFTCSQASRFASESRVDMIHRWPAPCGALLPLRKCGLMDRLWRTEFFQRSSFDL